MQRPSLVLFFLLSNASGQLCPDGAARSQSETKCDANTIKSTWYGKGTPGMIRQITYEVKSCCTKLQGEEKVAIKEWKQDSCDQVGAAFIKHTCTDSTTLVRSQFKDAGCTIPVEAKDQPVKHTCGTECLQEKTYELSYDCSLYKTAPKPKPAAPSAAKQLKSQGSIKVASSVALIGGSMVMALLLF